MKILLVDDEADSRWDTLFKGINTSEHSITVAISYLDAVQVLSEEKDFDLYMLDHDYSWECVQNKELTLEDALLLQLKETNSGTQLCRYIAEQKIGLDKIFILHSANHHGRASMASILKPNSQRLIIDFCVLEMFKFKAPLFGILYKDLINHEKDTPH